MPARDAHRHGDVTRLLEAVGSGSEDAAHSLLEVVYQELRLVARKRLVGQPGSATIEPTALVHEAYLRLLGGNTPQWANRNHFFAAAARSMRDIVIEHARRRAALKRGGGRKRLSLDESKVVSFDQPEELLSLDDSLDRLERAAPVSAQIVMLRFFAGLTVSEVAAALELSVSSVERHWSFAKAWLHRDLDKGN
jgi:RNA polymerase sigma factor (TIGR02999 family)